MAAIRSNVLKTLRQNCPAELEEPLEQLLADSAAVTAIQNLVSANLKTPAGITPAAVLALPMAADTKQLLTDNPPLVEYLVATAVAKLSR